MGGIPHSNLTRPPASEQRSGASSASEGSATDRAARNQKMIGCRRPVEAAQSFRIGVDENGLGARLGPLVVTAVLARVTERGARVISRRPPKRLSADLGDSKQLVSHKDIALGEAWARALAGR